VKNVFHATCVMLLSAFRLLASLSGTLNGRLPASANEPMLGCGPLFLPWNQKKGENEWFSDVSCPWPWLAVCLQSGNSEFQRKKEVNNLKGMISFQPSNLDHCALLNEDRMAGEFDTTWPLPLLIYVVPNHCLDLLGFRRSHESIVVANLTSGSTSPATIVVAPKLLLDAVRWLAVRVWFYILMIFLFNKETQSHSNFFKKKEDCFILLC